MKKFNTALFSIIFGMTAISMPIYNVSADTIQTPITRNQAKQRALNNWIKIKINGVEGLSYKEYLRYIY